MDYGMVYKSGEAAHYASEVMSDTPEELNSFYRRVHHWCQEAGIKLGEGTVAIEQTSPPFSCTYVVRAPLIEPFDVDPGDAMYIGPARDC